MSRIHEALKRAEREKGRLPAPVPQVTPVAEPVREPVREVDPIPAPDSVAAPAAVAPAASAAATVAPAVPIVPPRVDLPSLLASCRRPHWNEDKSRLFFLNSKGPTFATEQLRALRSRLYQMRERKALKTVLVTSTLPAEGKTFLCANLAHALARQQERRILLVDCDLRAPGLHEILGAPREPGLISFLRGEATAEQILQRGPQENVFLIPAGPIPAGKTKADAAALLAGGKLKGLLGQLAPLFDWILLDTPAAGAVPDALALADCCDGILFVVQEGKTPYDAAQSVTHELDQRRLLGVVLNRTERLEGLRAFSPRVSLPRLH